MKHSIKSKVFLKLAAVAAVAVVIALCAALSGCFLFGERDSRKWVINTVKENYYFYDDMDKEGLEGLSIEEVVKRLDIYSEYYTPSQLQALIRDNSGEKAGIGFSYSYLAAGASSLYPEGGCLIISIVGNSPAEKAGMKAGRLLVGGTYNGNEVSFDNDGDLEAFINPIATGTEFVLTDSLGKDYTVARREYTASYMFMATESAAYMPTFDENGEVNGLKESADGAMDFLPEGTAYISMSQFYGTAADEFGYLMKKFSAEGCTSLIFDLRDNGGGYVDVMSDLAGYFVSGEGGRKTSMTAEYRNGKKEIYYCENHTEGRFPAGTDLYVLANTGTASASEALIGVLISYDILKYENVFLSDYGDEFLAWAGEGAATGRSYGKGIMQTTFTNYMTGEALKLTTAQIFWPNNKCIHGVGLTEADGCRLVNTDWIVTPGHAELKTVVGMIAG